MTKPKRRMLEEGIPYQTLVSGELHNYASGGVRDLMADKVFQRTNKRLRRNLLLDKGV